MRDFLLKAMTETLSSEHLVDAIRVQPDDCPYAESAGWVSVDGQVRVYYGTKFCADVNGDEWRVIRLKISNVTKVKGPDALQQFLENPEIPCPRLDILVSPGWTVATVDVNHSTDLVTLLCNKKKFM